MRVLVVCDFDLGLLDGLSKTFDLVSLRDRVLVRKRDNTEWRDSRTRVFNLPIRVYKEEELVHLRPALSLGAYLVMATIVGIIEVVKRRLDAVLAIYAFPQGLVATIVGMLTRRKVAVLTDGGDLDILLRRPFIGSLILASLRKVTVVATLNKTKASMLSSLGIRTEIICPIIGVDTSHFQFVSFEDKERGSVLFVGRLSKEKCVDVLLEACSILRREGVRFKLRLVGDGPLRNQISETVRQLHLTHSVDIEGYVSHSEIHEYFSKSSVFVLPSIREGLSVALIEAMSSGCLCIVSDIPDNREVIRHGHNGFTFHANDEQDLAKEILGAISQQPHALSSVPLNARSLVEDTYSVQSVAKSIGMVLSRLSA
jgi:glycosyltransferase involved in cell wall biosynthesis